MCNHTSKDTPQLPPSPPGPTCRLRLQQFSGHVLQALNLQPGRLQQRRVCPVPCCRLVGRAAALLCLHPHLLHLRRCLLEGVGLVKQRRPCSAVLRSLLRQARALLVCRCRCQRRRCRCRHLCRLLACLCQLLLQLAAVGLELGPQALHLPLVLAHQLAHRGGCLQLADAQRLPLRLLRRLCRLVLRCAGPAGGRAGRMEGVERRGKATE